MLKYDLLNATNNDIDYIKKSKLYSIFKYAHDLPKDEILKINNYVEKSIPIEISNYKIIICNNKRIGCLLVTKRDDKVLLDEIYLEEEYRNRGIGTDIIKNILETNSNVYLWVYKENIKAIALYKKLKFKVIDETKTRYYMEYSIIH